MQLGASPSSLSTWVSSENEPRASSAATATPVGVLTNCPATSRSFTSRLRTAILPVLSLAIAREIRSRGKGLYVSRLGLCLRGFP